MRSGFSVAASSPNYFIFVGEPLICCCAGNWTEPRGALTVLRGNLALEEKAAASTRERRRYSVTLTMGEALTLFLVPVEYFKD